MKDLKRLEPLLDIPEVLDILRVSKTTLWRMVKRGDLAVVRLGGRCLFEKEELRRCIARGRRRDRILS